MIQVFELNYSEVYGNGKYDEPYFIALTPHIPGKTPIINFEVDVHSRDYVTVKLQLENRDTVELFPGDWVVVSEEVMSVITNPSEEMKKLLLGE